MILKGLYIKNRFFIALALVVFAFVLAYSFTGLLIVAKILLALLVIAFVCDIIICYVAMQSSSASRYVHPKLSLADHQSIQYELFNNSKFDLNFNLTDELPYQLQHRSWVAKAVVGSGRSEALNYAIRPTSRGKYQFGDLQLFISNQFISFIELRKTISAKTDIKVVPSILQMKKYELQVFSKTANQRGIRRIRQLGENDEFEHIRGYSQGDNIKAINWKATSRNNVLMVNQYQNTKSQSVYCIVDKGRSMKMPFQNLSLLDYVVNTSLVISNVVLRKYDKMGLITFSDKIGAVVKAQNNPNQLENISKQLYHQKTDFKESNFELLFYTLRRQISRRSVFLFFTNFENHYDLHRNLPYLKAINRRHLLVIVFFINTELIEASELVCLTKTDIYLKTFAEKTLIDKEKLMVELKANGIQTILTKPEELSINVINKYLEIKSKRML